MSNEYVQQASVEADGTVQDSAAPLDRRLVWLMAVVCAPSVANLYYVQPLLAMMGQSFHLSVPNPFRRSTYFLV